MNGLRQHWAHVALVGIGLVIAGGGQTVHSQADDPGELGPCSVSSQAVTINNSGSDVDAMVYYPSDDQCGATLAAPYPGLAFAHGFSMFGLSDGVADNAGNGEHLASWGYVITIPDLPDAAEERIQVMQAVLSFLEGQTATPGSFLYGKVDPNRLSAVGHSLGGATALALAARDGRVTAVVALDPVYNAGNPSQGEEPIWDPEEEGPAITVPTAILGAPAGSCNSQADFAEIYPTVGATHKGQYLVMDASHCDFADPGSSLCPLFCGDQSDPTGARTQLIQRTMTAWFNYYLHVDAGYYTFLYGDEMESAVQAGIISPTIHTAPRSFSATTELEAAYLTWDLYDPPIISGYRIYRTQQSGVYSDTPYAETGRASSYADQNVLAGEQYFYVLRSIDSAGNEHQASAEVHTVPQDHVYLPLILKGILASSPWTGKILPDPTQGSRG